jgi:hypothetical protein
MIEVHESDAARLDVPPRQLMPLVQPWQHLGTLVGSGQGIAIPQRALDLVPQQVNPGPQRRGSLEQFFEIVADDRCISGHLTQKPRSGSMHALMLRADRGEGRLVRQFGWSESVVPAAEPTLEVRILVQVVQTEW